MKQEQSSGCKRCRTWGEQMYWKHFSSMHFFLFLPEDFYHHLVLPPKFAENMTAKLPDIVSLIGPNATEWDIELKKTDNIEFSGDGWIEFVKTYDLEENDLLMFKCKQNSRFEVLVFDPESFCEKEASYFVNPCNHGKAGDENGKKRAATEAFSTDVIEDKDNDDDHRNDSEFVVPKKSKKNVAEGLQRRKSPQTSGEGMLVQAPRGRGRPKRIPGPSESQSQTKAQSEKELEDGGAVDDAIEKEPKEDGAAKEQSHVSEREKNSLENGGSVLKTGHSNTSTTKKGRPKKRAPPKSSRKLVFRIEKDREGNGLVHERVEQEPKKNGAGKEQSHVSERDQNNFKNARNVRETVCSLKSTERNGKPKKLVPTTSPRKSVLQSDSTAKKYSKNYKSNRRPVTEKEKENALKRALQGLSENSFFVVMRPTAVYTRFYLNIPAGWMKTRLLCRNGQVMLRVGEKTWPAVFYYNSRREGGLSGSGWKRFALENFLEEFDVCVFKLVNQEDDPEIVMEVEIFRVVPEVVPLSPVGRSTSTLS